jgi:hypothetical protein
MAGGMKNLLSEAMQTTVTTETTPQKKHLLRRWKH